ncbi:FAD-binding domain-containing protein [Staphylococcus xylosus]|uniref:FAD-binding domain-containing protein n=1 Tax=Staphylococcus xylosus TaxID=1288 RepID=UPI000733EB5B|nr:FAD-binding domain-containing protein [Staphylococcus xylosus]KTW20593.1 hypothetical protein NS341_13025 [Staphylococcus xylosus]
MYKHNIYPYVVSYKSLGKLADQLGLTHVLIGKDIMSYHRRQWSASTGTDAAPYFRMFNPIRQSERFDAKGYFIKSQLELFKDILSNYIHNPSKNKNKNKLKENYDIEIGKDYPETLVDLKLSREFIMNKFKSFR